MHKIRYATDFSAKIACFCFWQRLMLRSDDLINLQQQFQFLNTPIVIVDTEATGGNLYLDRLTEIALVRFDENGITTYQQLINPDLPISDFIEHLTGISNDMVADAPHFADIADELLVFLQDAILVAHNSRFDYQFLRLAFKRCGRHLSMLQLCTVKLSRQLYPQHFKHNLDSIIERFDIHLPQRHRAMADVAALTQFLSHASTEKAEQWQSAVRKHINPGLFPHWLSQPLATQIKALPDEYGVVLIWHAGSTEPKVRVCEHMFQDMCQKFQAKQAQDWFASIERIEGISAIGPIDAAIIASRYHHAPKSAFYTVCFVANEHAVIQAKIRPLACEHGSTPPFGVFAHPKAAKKALLEWARKHGFCPKQLDILPQTLAQDAKCPIQLSKQCHGLCSHLADEASIAQGLAQLAQELPIAGWQAKWSQHISETDPVTGMRKEWTLSRSAVQCEDGSWLWDAAVFQALKDSLRKPKTVHA